MLILRMLCQGLRLSGTWTVQVLTRREGKGKGGRHGEGTCEGEGQGKGGGAG
jgi:hypothetical protein